MAQIFLILGAFAFFWEGAKGFRSCGIKIGVFKGDGDSIKGTKGKVIGSLVIALGFILLFISLVYLPHLMRPIAR